MTCLLERPTIPPSFYAAVARGDAIVNRWTQLLETGTAEDIALEVARRGAAIAYDIALSRAERLWWRISGGYQRFCYERMLAHARFQEAQQKQITRDWRTND